MLEAYPVTQVYQAEEALMATLPSGALMQRAVAALVKVVRARMNERYAAHLVALVGPGNNGADALYAAAELAATHAVSAVMTPTVHEGALAAAREAGVHCVIDQRGSGPHDDASDEVSDAIAAAEVVLDGIAGLGGRSGLAPWAQPWVAAIAPGAYVMAVDLPSGVDPNAQAPLDCAAVCADETVTFSVAKPALLLPPHVRYAGRLCVVDIGLECDGPAAVNQWQPADLAAAWPVPGVSDNKYTRGVLGIVAGSTSYPGAAVLATRGAAQTGVGMVRYIGPDTPQSLIHAAVPEAVPGIGRVNAWVIGSGCDFDADAAGASATDEQRTAAQQALDSDLPVLLDAGGLDLLNGPRPAPTLLTPHAGECARMLTRLTGRDVTSAEVQDEPVKRARELADVTSATVLLKGHTTIIVAPDLQTPVQSVASAPSWLATAGAGDVLAGCSGALLASGLSPQTAGPMAALIHGLAAHRANPGGPIRAGDVADALPATIAGLLNGGPAGQ